MHSYDSLRPRVDTGDLILFSGKGGLSAGIKWLTRSRWSHIGMALRLPEWDVVLIWESTLLNDIEDVELGGIRQGVQLSPLSHRITAYEGDVAIRHLEVARTPAMLASLNALRQEVKGRSYEKSHLQLLKSAYDGPFGDNKDDLSSLFCSELIAEAYQRMGLLPGQPPPNEYTPKDFSEAHSLPLLRGRLGPELVVHKRGPARLQRNR